MGLVKTRRLAAMQKQQMAKAGIKQVRIPAKPGSILESRPGKGASQRSASIRSR